MSNLSFARDWVWSCHFLSWLQALLSLGIPVATVPRCSRRRRQMAAESGRRFPLDQRHYWLCCLYCLKSWQPSCCHSCRPPWNPWIWLMNTGDGSLTSSFTVPRVGRFHIGGYSDTNQALTKLTGGFCVQTELEQRIRFQSYDQAMHRLSVSGPVT